MTHKEFEKVFDENLAIIRDIALTKGADYSSGSDRLSNFKENAFQLGLSPVQVWGVYASKHWNAISAYVRKGQVESEPIESRIHDEILYLFLLLGLIEDSKTI